MKIHSFLIFMVIVLLSNCGGVKNDRASRETQKMRKTEFVNACMIGTHIYQMMLQQENQSGNPIHFSSQGKTKEQLNHLNDTFVQLVQHPTDEIKAMIEVQDVPEIFEQIKILNESGIQLAPELPIYVFKNFVLEKIPRVDEYKVNAVANMHQMVLDTERDGDLLQNLFHIYIALDIPTSLQSLGIDMDEDDFPDIARKLSEKCDKTPYAVDPAAWHIAMVKIHRWTEQYSGIKTAETYAKEILKYPELQPYIQKAKSLKPLKLSVLGHSFTMSLNWASQASFTDIVKHMFMQVNPGIEVKHVNQGGLDIKTAYTEYLPQILDYHPDYTLIVLIIEPDQYDALRSTIADIKEIDSKVIIPDGYTHLPPSWLNYNENVAIISEESGAEVYKVLEKIRNYPDADQFLSLDKVHMNSSYHKFMAAEFFKYFIELAENES